MRFAKLLAILSLTLGCAAASNAGEYEVRRFDTLSRIVVNYFDGNYALFKRLNPTVTSSNLRIGLVIRTP
jgi:hypothetical protein